jgi:hypothetical protein
MRFSRVIGAVGMVVVLMAGGSLAQTPFTFTFDGSDFTDGGTKVLKNLWVEISTSNSEDLVTVYGLETIGCDPSSCSKLLGRFKLTDTKADYFLSCIRTFMEKYGLLEDLPTSPAKQLKLKFYVENAGFQNAEIKKVVLIYGG